ncbi:MAG: ribonuclease J [Ruminococcaceae bacterium]|nr:ribonuclease J [Oscillospiraceae bacterium]
MARKKKLDITADIFEDFESVDREYLSDESEENDDTSRKSGTLRVISLGGLGEVGKNMTVLEYENDIIIIDCGFGFPDENMLGVDYVIPDTTYLQENADKVRGIYLTHGHEDHIGALPYVLKELNVPVYGTLLTLGILENKLIEHKMERTVELICVSAGDTIQSGCFTVEPIRVNHSIADSVAYAIKTPVGVVIYTGDFKIDLTPIEGEMMDLTRFGEYGKQGVIAMLCESTNAEREGFTPSERKVGQSFDNIFRDCKKRIIIATFSSNVHRVQQIIDASIRYGRKVAITGRSMINVVTAARKLGYMRLPDDMLIDISRIKSYRPEELTIITTGSQGEPMSALYRMAYSNHDKVELGLDDLVVISAHAIPGNEVTVNKIINELLKKGVGVVYDQVAEVHVSGHACREEIKLLTALVKPKYFIPIHGEYKHLVKCAEIAEYLGIEKDNIFISDIGRVLEITDDGYAGFAENVPSGKVLVDGLGVGDVGSVVLRDRKHLSQDGLIVVVAAVDTIGGLLVSEPDIVTRGFVYVKESEELMDEIKYYAELSIEECLNGGIVDINTMKSRIKDDLTKFLYSRTMRKPMILTTIIEI